MAPSQQYPLLILPHLPNLCTLGPPGLRPGALLYLTHCLAALIQPHSSEHHLCANNSQIPSWTPDSYIQLYVSISTWMSQTLYIQKRILIFLCIHFLPNAPSTVFQIKYLGVIPDCSFSHTSHLICQQILWVPSSKHTKNLSMSHDCHN